MKYLTVQSLEDQRIKLDKLVTETGYGNLTAIQHNELESFHADYDSIKQRLTIAENNTATHGLLDVNAISQSLAPNESFTFTVSRDNNEDKRQHAERMAQNNEITSDDVITVGTINTFLLLVAGIGVIGLVLKYL